MADFFSLSTSRAPAVPKAKRDPSPFGRPINTESPGPGFYDPPPLALHTGKPATMSKAKRWSNDTSLGKSSKLREKFRAIFEGVAVTEDTPAPGTYEAAKFDWAGGSSVPSAAFTTSKRPDLFRQLGVRTEAPGPEYDPMPPKPSSIGGCIPRAPRKVLRELDPDAVRERHFSPGPGAYDSVVPRSPGASRGGFITREKRFRRVTGLSRTGVAEDAANTFISTDRDVAAPTQRTPRPPSTPGPGSYADGIQASDHRNNTVKKGGAMTRAKRPPLPWEKQAAEAASMPGPGAYDPRAAANSVYF
eukprot:NODE_1892_length_1264_cov_27.405761_g1565_i0.p1 GENE.NODE_1892_length_1264_cov_27.405761_g1565_i0~~NODE_1892_length_1264_cov_27.405761_g1565_i0.p1  ORF type:complete len:303 (+),score=19.49 NODE_1892_length_1264_cov_27.405761_g1565_i0:177-1085(+)